MSTAQAAELMLAFAERTGLTGARAADRYLWTDAFAVCNFLELARSSGEDRFACLARSLVEQVHHVLGRHRDDDPRQGWLSGFGEAEGEAHPTAAGLRIGKPLPERGPDGMLDRRTEWDRDGQYFHYLTKWMHALDMMTRRSGEPVFNRWALELAKAAHDGFVYTVPNESRPRMYWKMSIDLTRPLVASMGHHDPLDGYITLLQLRQTAAHESHAGEGPTLDAELASFAAMVDGRDWTTTDPLGLGGLLVDAVRFAHLVGAGARVEHEILDDIIDSAGRGIEVYDNSPQLAQPAERRLAYRELGLAIGLAGVASLRGDQQTLHGISNLLHHRRLGERIIEFWRQLAHRAENTWVEYRNINDVMLATALTLEGVSAV
jgi:hypothetical protein